VQSSQETQPLEIKVPKVGLETGGSNATPRRTARREPPHAAHEVRVPRSNAVTRENNA